MVRRVLFFLVVYVSIVFPQPDSRFHPFDWVAYKQPGSVRSISEGYSYIYFGTETGGIWRYHFYRDAFDAPITTAQGLTSDNIISVFIDNETGILWAATDQSLDNSYTRGGEWTSRSLNEYALPGDAYIRRLGSSKNYLWGFTGTSFLKLDRTSGILLGVMLSPDEEISHWSSETIYFNRDIPKEWANYSFTDGWLLMVDQLVDPRGEYLKVLTTFTASNHDIWIGSEDGWVFRGDDQMEIFNPICLGPASNDVTVILDDNPILFAGRVNRQTKGFTTFYPYRVEFDHIYFESNINMNPQSIYSIADVDNEMWFGSDKGILVYNKKRDYWRQLDKTRGIPGLPVTAMSADTGSVWIGSPNGITRMLLKTKRSIPDEIDDILKNAYIYDIEVIENTVWIASEYYLLIYDMVDNILTDFRKYGNLEAFGSMANLFKQFREIYIDGDHVYVIAQNRVLSYSLKTKKWDFLIPSETISWNKKILSIAVIDDWCFLGTENGLIRYDRFHNITDNYAFPFLGQIREILIQDDILLLGTNNGLIQFNWNYDL